MALTMAVFTSVKPNSLRVCSLGQLVPSKLGGWGVHLACMWSSFKFLLTYCLYTVGLITSRLHTPACRSLAVSPRGK
jgi:hypothetical protein